MMCEAMNLAEPEKLIKMASKLKRTLKGQIVTAELIHEFMGTSQVDRASTSQGIIGSF